MKLDVDVVWISPSFRWPSSPRVDLSPREWLALESAAMPITGPIDWPVFYRGEQ